MERGTLRAFLRRKVAWHLALACWVLRVDRLGNHFEDVAFSGKRWKRRCKHPNAQLLMMGGIVLHFECPDCGKTWL